MKRCSKCGQHKHADEFHRDRSRADGCHPWCMDCSRSVRRANYRRNRERNIAASTRWRKDNPERYKALRARGMYRLKMYGLTAVSYHALLAAQDGRCAICRTDKPGKRLLTWMIDHDHATGEVRGILCENCNRALGMMADDPSRLRAAADYLEKVMVARLKLVS